MAADRQRIDKWLFFARVAKSRTLAAKMTQAGRVRVNGEKIAQASREVQPDDVLTITLDRRVLVYRIADCGTRRGPAPEARLLYEDLSPPAPAKPSSALDRAPAERTPGAGRPTKKERREIDRFSNREGGID
ncbi:RNA-binding S4 domain-containing protein [Oricola sp.]|uniref:RNA-binding S4 domain-containing protein n=1 Tax=Oricola sp. TaxID=1979950 RepID=UPI003BA86AB6